MVPVSLRDRQQKQRSERNGVWSERVVCQAISTSLEPTVLLNWALMNPRPHCTWDCHRPRPGSSPPTSCPNMSHFRGQFVALCSERAPAKKRGICLKHRFFPHILLYTGALVVQSINNIEPFRPSCRHPVKSQRASYL